MANQTRDDEIEANINSRIDELERKISVELSNEKKQTILNEINQIDQNDPNYMTFKAARLIQHANYCNNLILQRQALLLELISKTSNSQRSISNLILNNFESFDRWSYADLIRTITLIVNSIGVILATIFNSIQISRR